MPHLDRPDRLTRRGIVLLEVIVALTILAVGATAMLTLASESVRAVDRAELAHAAP